MEGLELDNILEVGDIENLFTEENLQETPPEEKEKEKETNNETTEVNTDNLFVEPESVGSGDEDNKEKEETSTEKETVTSPNNNFYSSIAKALQEEGILPDLNEDITNSIKSAEDFAEAIENQIQAKLDEKQKRVDEALNAGLEPTEIGKYERMISYLDSITDDVISDESEKGETLRKQLIYQDYINRGYSQDRANREVEKSFNAGTDIDDAKEALQGNKDFFKDEYDDLVKEAKDKVEADKLKTKEEAELLKKSIMEEKKVFGDIEVDKATRQKAYDNISKPVYRDPKTGVYYTAIQKYQTENKADFLKNLSLVFTLTDGFKNLDKLVKPKVNKEVKRGLRDLENTINNTSRNSDGSLKFVTGVSEDPHSIISKGYSIDI